MNFQPIRRASSEAAAERRGQPQFLSGRRERRAQDTLAPIFDARSFTIDFAMLILASIASVASAPAASLRTDIFSLAVFCVAVLAVLVYFGLYRPSFATHFLEDARAIVAATAIVAMCMTFGRVLIFDNPDAAAQAVRAWIFASTYVIAARAGSHLVDDAAPASWDHRSTDADHRRRRGRPTVRGAARPATRVRPQAGGVPRRRPARGHRGQCDDDPGPELTADVNRPEGPVRPRLGVGDRGTADRPRDRQLLDQLPPGGARPASPLPELGHHGVGPAAVVRRGDRSPRARAYRRHPDRLGSADGPAGLAIRGQVSPPTGCWPGSESCSPLRS